MTYSKESVLGNSSSTLTIVIPAYNETKRIISTLNKIDEYINLNQKASLLKVKVINDGSLDDTEKVVRSWIEGASRNKNCFSVESYFPNKGKGYAVNYGFRNITTDLVMYSDADSASPVEEAEKLIYFVENGFDVVCGSRILKGDNVKVSMGIKRRSIGFVFHMILSVLGLADIKDTQCGFKLFRTKAAQKIINLQKCFNYAFDVEYLFLAKRLGFKIKEVPVNWCHVEGSKINIFADSIKMLTGVLKIRFVYKYN